MTTNAQDVQGIVLFSNTPHITSTGMHSKCITALKRRTMLLWRQLIFQRLQFSMRYSLPFFSAYRLLFGIFVSFYNLDQLLYWTRDASLCWRRWGDSRVGANSLSHWVELANLLIDDYRGLRSDAKGNGLQVTICQGYECLLRLLLAYSATVDIRAWNKWFIRPAGEILAAVVRDDYLRAI